TDAPPSTQSTSTAARPSTCSRTPAPSRRTISGRLGSVTGRVSHAERSVGGGRAGRPEAASLESPRAAGEALGLTPRGARLHVRDPVAPDRQHVEPPLTRSVRVRPLCGADQPVGPHHREVRPQRQLASSTPLDRRRQDLTGLVGAPSRGRVPPPEEAAGDAPPLGVL